MMAPLPLPLAPGVWLFGLHGVQALRHRGGGSVSRPQRRPVPGLPRRHGENQGGPQLWILSSWGDSQWHTARCTCGVGEVRLWWFLFRGVMVEGSSMEVLLCRSCTVNYVSLSDLRETACLLSHSKLYRMIDHEFIIKAAVHHPCINHQWIIN